MRQVLPIGVVVAALPIAVDYRTGCQRTFFKYWNVVTWRLMAAKPVRRCFRRRRSVPGGWDDGLHTLTGGVWWPYDDEATVTPAGGVREDQGQAAAWWR